MADGGTGTAAGDLRLATLDVAATLEDGAFTVTAEGAAVSFATASSTDLEAGYYLLRVSETGATTEAPVLYNFAFSHNCEADGGDSPLLALDDAVLAANLDNAGISADIVTEDAIPSIICGDNTDAFAFDPIGEGNIVVNFTGANDLVIAVTSIDKAAATPTEVPVTDVSDTEGATRTITIPNVVSTKRYLVRVSETTPSSASVAYSTTVDMAYTPPANDLCGDAVAMSASVAGEVTTGSNVGGTSDVDGLCNGDIGAVEADKGAEVFYALTIDSTTSLELALTGTSNAFGGTVNLFAAPDGCPTDLSTLVPVGVNGAATTAANIGAACGATVRLSDVPAGDYLAVVEGNAGFNFLDIFVGPPSVGGFDLQATLFPDGFPPPQACTEATAITLPAAGSSTQNIVPADFSATGELEGSCRGAGREKIFSFTAATAGDVTFSTTAEGSIDTVVYLLEGTCSAASEVEGACNDDNDAGGLGSLLTASLTAGTDYFLVVDSYGDLDDAAATVLTIAVE